ncbi:acetyl-CoA synthetase (ADP-forming)/acetyltransferase [Pseudoduganella lurida]|uniref:Acetyl-CoA synthetase (ADP-forming)/acetyltransferase n=1 Tax=Pseudoduganella lurida TaxID=1036180 RepID=A0A562R0X0_9BURK|nr:GNAT family N-acetyltransferase [Pseudoduganella lurida]TWI62483.1 acetyl-CoA synthetase (ADP-forming)/acetyltransferase [Pseudoduganella lurida]
MSVRNLEYLFEPRSIAIVGASQRPGRLGTTVLDNMAASGFAGPLWPVNPKYDTLRGIACHARIAALPAAPDLAVLCTPPDTLPGLVAELGARGTRAAIVLTPLSPERDARLHAALLKAARPHLLRILGPGGTGLIAPAAGVNASVAHVGAQAGIRAGQIAFVAQSGMLMTALLDWAGRQHIGFSRVVSLGGGGDVDVADLLDFLAGDADTQAIVLHLESFGNARKFLSAARVAARGKPVVVLKSGRGTDREERVIDAAIRRAGMLRVYSSADLFDAVQTVARARTPAAATGEHERLAVISNATSLGLLATDALAWTGGRLATLSPATVRALQPLLEEGAQPANPLDIGVRAGVDRHVAAVRALLDEPGADALLLVHVPTASAGSTAVAQALAPLVRAAPRTVLSCWLGGDGVQAARTVFADAGLPTYDTPEKAVRAFRQIVQYQRNQALLNEVPAQVPATGEAERAAARAIVAAARRQGRGRLREDECRTVLAAYGIGSVAPQDGNDGGPPLRIAMHVDPVFGPVLDFGLGGAAGRLVPDGAAGLPPLNLVLARDIVRRSRAGGLLADPAAACRMLVRVADLVTDLAEVAALQLDPLEGADDELGAAAAHIELGPARPEALMAIRPYPQALEETVQWQGAPLLLRPIRPEDGPAHVRFFAALDQDDVRLRFFTVLRELPPAQLARLTQIDYDRAMAFIATRPGADGMAETLGVVRAVADPDNHSAEFAVVVRSDLKGLGLGTILFGKLVAYFRARGTGALVGDALARNDGVQGLVRRFGGSVRPGSAPDSVRLAIPLHGKSS